MRNKPNLAISQRREYENLKILLYFCNLLELIVQIWWSLKNNSLKSFALFFSQKAFAWVSLDLIYLLPSNFMMLSRWQSSISQFNQIWLSKKYELKKKKSLYMFWLHTWTIYRNLVIFFRFLVFLQFFSKTHWIWHKFSNRSQ